MHLVKKDNIMVKTSASQRQVKFIRNSARHLWWLSITENKELCIVGRIRCCINYSISWVKKSIDSTTTTFPSMLTIIVNSSNWFTVFSCLKVVLKHMIQRQTIRRIDSDMWRRQGKTASATSIAIMHLLVVAQEYNMKVKTENLSKWDNRAALAGL